MTQAVDKSGQPWDASARHRELWRIQDRREAQGLPHAGLEWSRTIGLALSGGGIRSATLSLGALQTLARFRLLPSVDILSTVSGGGYIGAFFMSLFARLLPPLAVGAPYQLLAGSCSRPDEQSSPGVDASRGRALWWLRNSGRYLAPTGAGDYVYAVAMQIRNWFGLHLVLGIALMVLAGPTILLDAGLRAFLAWATECTVDAGFGLGLLGSALFLAWSAPVGFAFFACEMPQADAPTSGGGWWRRRTMAVFAATAAVLALGAIILRPVWAAEITRWTVDAGLTARLPDLGTYVGSSVLSDVFGGIALVLAISLVFYMATAIAVSGPQGAPASTPVSPQGLMQATRVNLTKNLATSMKFALMVLGAGVAVGLSHYAVANWDALPVIKTGTGGAIALFVVRQVATFASQPAKQSLLRRIPIDALALLIGATLLALLVIAWFCLAWAIVAIAGGAPLGLLTRPVDCMPPLVAVTLLMCAVGLAVARSFQFINMSTLQSLYASRLTRAYLGASNSERIRDPDPRWTRLSDPHPADDLTLARYYDASNGAPLHLINVTLNETVSPTDPLVQRDRHGRPMSITPDHYAVDGLFSRRDGGVSAPAGQAGAAKAATAAARPRAQDSRSEPEQLSLGQWISISGAAFSTGVGRQTSLGKAVSLGLANVRLGHWWRAGGLALKPMRQGLVDNVSRTVARAFETQSYLFSELLARFSGRYARYWYLSDGGHFENLGLYELVRRRIGLVIVCENGADPQYSGDDVANAMRLCRIDFGTEFFEFAPRMLRPISALAPFADALMTLDTPGRGAYLDDSCLRLLWAYPPDVSPANLDQFIQAGTAVLMIKPRLIRAASTDVREYARTHAAFPQETTADQFFSEEQWESYRKLGQTTAAVLVRALQNSMDESAPSFAELAALRHALGHVAGILLADPRTPIAETPELAKAMAEAAQAAAL